MAVIFHINQYKKGMITMSALAPRPILEIEALADEKLRAYSIDTIPINPLIIAQNERIGVYNAEFTTQGISGMIMKSDEEVSIYINDAEFPTRKKFTIAHELGHFFLHLNDQDGDFVDAEVNFLFRSNEGPRDIRETEANQFAAALLMPKRQVFRVWENVRSINEMARIFEVSYSAMGYRLGNLGLV